MKEFLVVGAGSFLGGGLRYLLSQFIQGKTLIAFPFGTLSVNVIGCFLIGIVFGFAERSAISAEWRLFLATGILGGFTTFSAFSLETITMIRDGQWLCALAYVASSVLIGSAATFIGISITRVL